MSIWKRWFLLSVDQNMITICTFIMFQNVLFKIAQFTNDIVHAVNHVLSNFHHSWEIQTFQEEEKEEKEKRKRKKWSIYLYLFIHSFILTLTRKTVHKKKRGGKHGKYSKLIQLKPAPLLLIIISVHILPLVYSYSFILESVQHYVQVFWLRRCQFSCRRLICVLNSIITCNVFLKSNSRFKFP